MEVGFVGRGGNSLSVEFLRLGKSLQQGIDVAQRRRQARQLRFAAVHRLEVFERLLVSS